jgi:hypothetical protein
MIFDPAVINKFDPAIIKTFDLHVKILRPLGANASTTFLTGKTA